MAVWVFVALLAAVPGFWALTGSSVQAREFGRGPHGGLLGHALEGMDLTDAQKHDIAVILKEKREEAKGCMGQMSTARKNLFALTGAPEYNEAEVRRAAHQVAEIQEQLMVLRAGAVHRIQSVLTPEQRAKWSERRAHFAEKKHDHMHDGFGHMDEWIDAHSR